MRKFLTFLKSQEMTQNIPNLVDLTVVAVTCSRALFGSSQQYLCRLHCSPSKCHINPCGFLKYCCCKSLPRYLDRKSHYAAMFPLICWPWHRRVSFPCLFHIFVLFLQKAGVLTVLLSKYSKHQHETHGGLNIMYFPHRQAVRAIYFWI